MATTQATAEFKIPTDAILRGIEAMNKSGSTQTSTSQGGQTNVNITQNIKYENGGNNNGQAQGQFQIADLAAAVNSTAELMRGALQEMVSLTKGEIAQTSMFREWLSAYNNTVNKADFKSKRFSGKDSIDNVGEALQHRGNFANYVIDKMTKMAWNGRGALQTTEGKWTQTAVDLIARAQRAETADMNGFTRDAAAVLASITGRGKRFNSRYDKDAEPGKTPSEKKREAEEKKLSEQTEKQAEKLRKQAEELDQKQAAAEADAAKRANAAKEKANRKANESRKKVEHAAAKADKAEADAVAKQAAAQVKEEKEKAAQAKQLPKEYERFAGMRRKDFLKEDGTYDMPAITRYLKERNGGQAVQPYDTYAAKYYLSHVAEDEEAAASAAPAPAASAVPTEPAQKQEAVQEAKAETKKKTSRKKAQNATKRGQQQEVKAEAEKARKAAQAEQKQEQKRQKASAAQKKADQEKAQAETEQAKTQKTSALAKDRDIGDYIGLDGRIADGKIRSALREELGAEPTEYDVSQVRKQLLAQQHGARAEALQPAEQKSGKRKLTTQQQIDRLLRRREHQDGEKLAKTDQKLKKLWEKQAKEMSGEASGETKQAPKAKSSGKAKAQAATPDATAQKNQKEIDRILGKWNSGGYKSDKSKNWALDRLQGLGYDTSSMREGLATASSAPAATPAKAKAGTQAKGATGKKTSATKAKGTKASTQQEAKAQKAERSAAKSKRKAVEAATEAAEQEQKAAETAAKNATAAAGSGSQADTQAKNQKEIDRILDKWGSGSYKSAKGQSWALNKLQSLGYDTTTLAAAPKASAGKSAKPTGNQKTIQTLLKNFDTYTASGQKRALTRLSNLGYTGTVGKANIQVPSKQAATQTPSGGMQIQTSGSVTVDNKGGAPVTVDNGSGNPPPVTPATTAGSGVRWFDSLREYTDYMDSHGLHAASQAARDRLGELDHANVTGIRATFDGTRITDATITAEHMVNGELKTASIQQAVGYNKEGVPSLRSSRTSTDSDMADAAALQARQEALQLRNQKTLEELSRLEAKAGGVDRLTETQQNLRQSALGYHQRAEQAISAGRFQDASTAMASLNTELGRLKTSLSDSGYWDQQISKFDQFSKALDEMSTSRNGGFDQWTKSQQDAYRELESLKSTAAMHSSTGNRGGFEETMQAIQAKQSDLDKSFAQSKQLISDYNKAINSELFKGVGNTLKQELGDAFKNMMADGSAESMNKFGDALARVQTAMQSIQQQDVFRQQSQQLDTLSSKLNAMSTKNGGMSNWTDKQREQFQNAQMTWASLTQMHGGNVAAGMALPGGGVMTADMLQRLPNFGTFASGLKAANQQAQQLNNSFRVMGAGAGTVDTQVDALSRHLASMAAPMMMWRRVSGYMKEAAKNVAAIDTQMADLKKVTNNTNAEYDQFLTSTGRNAVAIGAKISDLVQTTSTFAHMGYSLSESQALGVTATKFGNVGNFQTTNDAAEAMIAVIKGFDELGIKDADLVGDKLTAVANNYAVTANDIAEGLQKSASALNVAGNNVDQSTAMITAIAEVTRDAGAAGSALKVLSMRIRGAKTE